MIHGVDDVSTAATMVNYQVIPVMVSLLLGTTPVGHVERIWNHHPGLFGITMMKIVGLCGVRYHNLRGRQDDMGRKPRPCQAVAR